MGAIFRGRKCYTGKVKDTSQYSTDEQFTGEYWIDGKPIYRKVIHETTNTYSDGGSRRTYELSTISGADCPISVSGYFKVITAGSTTFQGRKFALTTNMASSGIMNYGISAINQNDATIHPYLQMATDFGGSGGVTNVEVYVAIEYTKT